MRATREEIRAFFADRMAIEFPCPPGLARLRIGEPTMIYKEAVQLLSVDALAAYCFAHAHSVRCMALDLKGLSAKFKGDVKRARKATKELYWYGLFITAEEAEQRRQEYEAEAEAARLEAKQERESRKLVAPDPWPQYSEERWTGSRMTTVPDLWPPSGTPVVYFLFDADKTLIYIGSTGNAPQRLWSHWDKQWMYYVARSCSDRESAYWLEAAEILKHRPPLNKDRWCGGRVNHVPKSFRATRAVVAA